MPAEPNAPSPLSHDGLVQAWGRAELTTPVPVLLKTTDSTNSDAMSLAADGSPAWTVVVAEKQLKGRGRLDRSWESTAGDAVLFSVILRPPVTVPVDRLGWIPLLAGVAVTESLSTTVVSVGLKWPNDLVVDGPASDGSAGPRKLGGILAERGGTAIVVGVGINLNSSQGRLPVPAATSLALEGADPVDREQLLADLIVRTRTWWDRWASANGDAQRSGLMDRYEQLCLTLGRQIKVLLPGREPTRGQAVRIDDQGCLVVDVPGKGQQVIAAGDVVHVR
ncbi:MAG: biotin--[acetyl-CoA-carboxylase] ligase [Candidatus Nanopelagicales bacterium]